MTDEMHSLLGKYFSGQATAEERTLVQQWAAANEENRADFDLLEKLWHRSGEHETIQFDTAKAWNTVDTKIKSLPLKGSHTPVRRMKFYTRAIAVAASLVLVLGAWWIIGGMNDRTLVADVAVKEILLEDGSKVYLRNGSTLKYKRAFGGERREVSLTGQAFFEVTPDPARPFIIDAAKSQVEVVGTSFSVNTQHDSVELIVKTGKVNFSTGSGGAQRILVVAGERAVLKRDQITKSANGDGNFDAWQSGQLVFTNTPLQQVIASLKDYYNVEIRLKAADAAQLAATGVTARFNGQSLNTVLDELALITSYRIQKISDTQYEISIK